jgi:hypothetical protein
VIMLQAGRPINRDLIPGRDESLFLSSQRPDRLWYLHSLLSSGYRGVISPGGKAAKAWSWPLTEVKLYVFLVCCLIRHWDNYAFFALSLKFDLYWEHAHRQLRQRLIIGSYGGQAVHVHHRYLTELDANLFPIAPTFSAY